jgi:hypothetical protein
MTAPTQPDLFGNAEPMPAPAGGADPERALIRIQAPAAQLSKAQREFNRLIGRIERLRGELADWRLAQERAQVRQGSEVAPLHACLRTLQRELVLWIDDFLARPSGRRELRLTAKQRLKLTWMLLYLSRAVLADGSDPEVEAAHDRHAQRSHGEDQREQIDLAAAMLGSVTGDESLFEGPADSLEDLLERATQRLHQKPSAAEDGTAAFAGFTDKGAPRRPSARAQQAQARDAQAREEAGRSVREVYRRLVGQLHPDRESDPAERERKTALMARVNDAYGRSDLLELLTVQMAIEQIDEEHLRSVSEQRLRHYIRVLKEQEQTLVDEIDQLRLPLMDPMTGLPNQPGRWSPRLYDEMVDDQLQQLLQATHQIEADGAELRADATRKAFLNGLRIDDPDAELDPFEAMLLEQELDEMMAMAMTTADAPGRRRRR